MLSKIAPLFWLVLTAITLHAAPRDWKNQDGSRTIRAELIKRDPSSITIRRTTDFKDIIIPVAQIHADDRAWLDANYPLNQVKKTTGKPNNSDAPDDAAVFDKLSFGDTRDEVLAKLKTSKFVELSVDETFLGRTGLNDVFRTRKKIGGLDASLFFDWTEDGKLKEVTLQTKGLPADALKTQLTPCWKEFAELLTTLYGKPTVAEPEIHLSSVRDGSMSPTHLWSLEKKGSAMLGASRDGDHYQIVVRFTQKTIAPVPVQ